MQECPHCEQARPPSDFYKGQKKCRVCLNDAYNQRTLKKALREDPARAARILARRNRVVPEGHQWCGGCREARPFDAFTKSNLDKKGWCRSCNHDYGLRRNMALKKRAMAFLGGRCVDCGFDRHWAALAFHHPDPEVKEMDWSQMKKLRWEQIRSELEKCVLLCHCCHTIRHCKFDNDGNLNPDFVPPRPRK